MFKKQFQTKPDVLTFRRFSRKPYAVFLSLNHEVRIGVLSAATLAFANVNSISAQTQKESRRTVAHQEYELDSVEVIGARAPLAGRQSARPVTVLTRRQIEGAAVQSINDVLKLATAVDVRQRGAYGVQADISINGGTFDQVTVLLNGVPLNNPQTGHLNFLFPVSVQDIERVEVLEGAASRVYGVSAFSGAVNIVTKNAVNNGASIYAKGGSFGTAEAGAGVNLKKGALSNHISGDYGRSDGATSNSDFNKANVFYTGSYDNASYRLNWQAGFTTVNYGANTFYSGQYPDQYEENRRYLVSVSAETKGKVHFLPTVYWNRSMDHYQLIRNTPTGENFHRVDVYGATLNAYTDWLLGRTSLGAEVRNEGILSTSLGKPLQEGQEVDVPGQADKRYTRKDNRTNIGYYLEHTLTLDKWTFSAGVLANQNTALDSKFHFYPGIDIAFRPADNWKLAFSWNKALRMPTFTDLYYKSPTQEGNVGLKPEETQEYSLHLGYRSGGFAANVKGFYRKGTNMIDWVLYPSDAANNYTTFHSANFKLDNMGYSVDAALDFTRLWGAGSWLRTLSAGYTYIWQERHDDVEIYKSNYAMEYLRHKVVVSLSHRIVSRLSADWNFRWQDRVGSFQYFYDPYMEDGKRKWHSSLTSYSPYGSLDVKIRWSAPRYTLFFEGNNLTSHRYYDIGNVLQPGFWFMAGATFSLNW